MSSRKDHKVILFGLVSWLVMSCGGTPAVQDSPIASVRGMVVDIPALLDTLRPVRAASEYEDTACFKLVSYFDATGCTSCKLKELYVWRRMLALDSISSCLFVFNTSKMEAPVQTLSNYRFNYPMYMDSLQIFEHCYPQLSKIQQFHTFLLDRDNRVILVGSPIGNSKMWNLYKSTIERLKKNGGVLDDANQGNAAGETGGKNVR